MLCVCLLHFASLSLMLVRKPSYPIMSEAMLEWPRRPCSSHTSHGLVRPLCFSLLTHTDTHGETSCHTLSDGLNQFLYFLLFFPDGTPFLQEQIQTELPPTSRLRYGLSFPFCRWRMCRHVSPFSNKLQKESVKRFPSFIQLLVCRNEMPCATGLHNQVTLL